MGGFSYPDEFIYDIELLPEAMGAGVLGVFLVIYVLVILFSLAWSMAAYALHSFGLYTIASRRGIHHSWLAWVPVGNLWLLGSISDQYQYVTKGKINNRRKVMLALSIIIFVAYFALLFGLLINVVLGGDVGDGIAIALGALAMFVLAIVLAVFQWMCYYDLFSSCQPGNAVLYLVLSILFGATLPFFVFFSRKKDLGMPPRKNPAGEVIPEAPAEEVPVEEAPAESAEPVEEGFAQPEEFEE